MVTRRKRTRVLIADARQDVREALTALLDATDEFEVVAEATSTREAVDLIRDLTPDIVLLDPCGRYDEEALARLALRSGTLIFLTLQDGLACRARARALGAVFVDKGTSPEDLLAILRRASPFRGARTA